MLAEAEVAGTEGSRVALSGEVSERDENLN